MLYLVITYDPAAKRARAYIATGEREAEAFDKVARLVPTVETYGAVTRQLNDFLLDVAELPGLVDIDRMAGLVETADDFGE